MDCAGNILCKNIIFEIKEDLSKYKVLALDQGDVNYTSKVVRYSLIYVDYVLVTFSYEYSTLLTHYKEHPYPNIIFL